MPPGVPGAAPPAGPAAWEAVRRALQRERRVVLRGLVTPARLAAFRQALAAGPAGGWTLQDILPAPQGWQLVGHLLGPDFRLVEARLLPAGAVPAGRPPAGLLLPHDLALWLPLADGAGFACGDLLLLTGGAPPAGPEAVLLRFQAAAPPLPQIAASPALRSACAAAAAAARRLRDDPPAPPGQAGDVVLALARAAEEYRPDQLLPPLRAALAAEGLLPDDAPPWPMPEAERVPEAAPLPPLQRASFGLCMSVRDHAGLLPRALEGLAAQTRPFDRIVLVNDGSTDATAELLEAFAARHPGVEVLHNPQPLGTVASTGRALERLGTDWLAWAAADDLLLPEALQHLAEAATAWPGAGLVLGETQVVELADGRFGPPGRMAHGGSRLVGLPPFLAPAALPALLSCRRLAFGTAWLLRRDLLVALGGFEAAAGPQADFLALVQALCRHGAAIVARPLSLMSVDRGSYAHRTARNPGAAVAARDAVLARLKAPDRRDIGLRIAATPSLVMDLQSAAEMFTTYFVFRPQHWDLAVRALRWALQHGAMSIGRGPPG